MRIQFDIPELQNLPPEQREAVLRRCVESEEFARKWKRIRRITSVSWIVAAIAVINVFAWTRIGKDHDWLGGVLSVVTVVFFIAVMLITQTWFHVRLVRKLVRREVANS